MSDRPSPRDRLLRAARDVVAADGLEGLTLRAIARRAGVSHGAPLRHFPSLAALLSAVAADGFARLIATIERDLAAAESAAAASNGDAAGDAGGLAGDADVSDTAEDPAARDIAGAPDAGGVEGGVLGARQRLGVAARSYVDFALADPGVFSVMFRPERVDVTDQDYQLQGFASFSQLVGLVEAAQADGWHADLPPAELAAVLWAHVHGIAVLMLHGALPAVVGDGAGSLPALSAALVLDLDMPATVRKTHQGEPA